MEMDSLFSAIENKVPEVKTQKEVKAAQRAENKLSARRNNSAYYMASQT